MAKYTRNPKQVTAGIGVDMQNSAARHIAFDVIPKLRPTVGLGLNDYHQTHLLWEATNRETLMLFRHVYDPYDDQWWQWKPQDWKNHYTQVDNNVKQFGKDYSRDLIHTLMNEPKDITNRAEEWMDFVLDVLRWAKNNGFRLAFPIPNVEVEWDALMVQGKFDRLLKAYDDEGFREHGHIGFIHEYTLFHINEGLAAARIRGDWTAMWPDAFLHPDKMTPENWATKEEVETLWASNYTLCRGMRVNKRMEALGREPIPLVRTEAWWDKLPHLQDWEDPRTGKRRNFYDEVLARYQVQPPKPHTAFAGAASFEPLYRKMLPHIDWSKDGAFADSIVEQIQHVHEVEPDYYLGTCWFQLDPDDPRWDINGGYSPHRIPRIWQKLYAWADELRKVTPPPPVVTDLPTEGWYAGKASAFAVGAHIRSARSKTAPALGFFQTANAQDLVDVKSVYAPRLNPWRAIEWNGIRGWVDGTSITFHPQEPPFNTGDYVITPDRWQRSYKVIPVGKDPVNARSSPTLGDNVIGQIPVGGLELPHITHTNLTPLERTYVTRSEPDIWLVFQFNGKVGFIRSDVVRVEPIPVTPPPVEETVPKELYDTLKAAYDELEEAATHMKQDVVMLAQEVAYFRPLAEDYIALRRLFNKPIEPQKELVQ